MAEEEQKVEAEAAAEAAVEEESLLSQAIGATKQTESSQAEELLRTLTEQALEGTVTWSKNLTATFNKAIAAIDAKLSEQLAVVMHAPEFRELEGTWRGLQYLVMNSETSSTLKLKVLNISKRELFKDLDKAVEFDQSQMFKKLYENEFGMPGGEPYGALIGDYQFYNHPEDIDLLSNMSNVAAAAFCPFISAADPKLMGFDDWTELSKPRDLEKIFESVEYTRWRSYRESDDSRFVTLTLPRALARLPYGANTKPIEDFAYEESPDDAQGRPQALPHQEYCWMNSAYVMGAKLTDAFAKYSWCAAIRGVEGGGLVEGSVVLLGGEPGVGLGLAALQAHRTHREHEGQAGAQHADDRQHHQ